MHDWPQGVLVSSYIRKESEPTHDLIALLRGRVFHVTRASYVPSILQAGFILPNADGVLPTTFGSSQNGFFRLRGCVSVFDYRNAPSEEIETFGSGCYPFQPAVPGGDGIAILTLSPETHERLLPWTLWHQEGAYKQMVVPHAEAGYPGPVAVSLISEVMYLSLTEDPDSLAAMFRAVYRRP